MVQSYRFLVQKENNMKKELEELKQYAEDAVKKIADFDAFEALENELFSRKHGKFTELMKGMKEVSDDMRKEVGQMANDVRTTMMDLLGMKQNELKAAEMANLAEREKIDVTEPLLPQPNQGHLHPLTTARWKMEGIAKEMGFIVEDGPELESDHFVFEALNIPKDHPARDGQDTFYVKGNDNWCMRSHVSNMQVRLMSKYNEGGQKAVRAAYPGRVFRNEALDATHEHTFYQFEALMVDKELNIGHLVATIKTLLKGLYGKEMEVRLRPGYFPFVEPGFELDLKADIGRGEEWIEMLGCGLMHPNVLREAGYDPDEWQGFAFGMGLNRLVMVKHGIEDIRHFHSGDQRFIEQF